MIEALRKELPARYLALEPLARGGMGALFAARDREADRDIVIKTVPPELLAASPELRSRFVREAETLRLLSHPYVVEVFEVVQGEAMPYFVMERIRAETLKEVMAGAIRRDVRTILRTVLEICDALIHAHFRNVVHRDIKPGNIFVLPHGGIKLVDFGLARAEELTRMTQSGEVMGTPLYMAPEQVRGEEAGPQSDLYSVATILYEYLTGETPFSGGGYRQKAYEMPRPPSEQNPEISPELEAVVMKGLATNPEDRQASMEELKWELSACLKDYRTHEDLGLAGAGWEALLRSDLEQLSLESAPVQERIELAVGEVREVTMAMIRLRGLEGTGRDGPSTAMAFVRDRILRVLATEVERFGGAVDRYGLDGLMAYFGSRATTGTDCEQAIRAGLGILEKLPPINRLLAEKGLRLEVGIGIDVAQVSVGENGAIDADGFGLTSRGDELPAGEIRLSAAARERAGDGFNLGDPRGDLTPVLGLAPRPAREESRHRQRTRLPLVGREQELEVLAGAWIAQVEDPDGRPGIVGVRGAPGIGKARLVEEFVKVVERQDPPPTLWASCSAYERSPYFLVIRILRRLLRLPEELSPEEGEEHLAACDVAKEHADVLAFLFGFRGRSEDSPTALKKAIGDAVAAVFASRPRGEVPGVLVLQDLQWLDEPSREVLEGLLPELGGESFLLLLHRQDFQIPERWKRHGNFRDLELTPLGPAAARELMERALGEHSLSQSLVGQLIEGAGGNPLFLSETLEYLLEMSWSGTEDRRVPRTVQAVVLSRFDLLPRLESEALQACAVLGSHFDTAVLEEMARRVWGEEVRLDEVLRQLEAAKFLELDLGEGGGRFREALTRDVVYGTLLESNRRLLHELAGLCMEEVRGDRLDQLSAELAHHFHRAQEFPKALDYTRRALERAVARYDNKGILRLASEALDLLERTGGSREERYEVLSKRARVHERTGKKAEQREDLAELEQLAEELGDEGRASDVQNRLSWFHWWIERDYDEAERCARAALEVKERLDDVAGQALAWRNLGSLSTGRERYEEALGHHVRAAELYERCGDVSGQAASLCSIAINRHALGGTTQAIAEAEQALELDRGASDLRGVGRELRHLGEFHHDKGDLVKAGEYFEQALENDRRIGYRKGQALNLIHLGRLELDLRDERNALGYFQEAHELAVEIGDQAAAEEALRGRSRAFAGATRPPGPAS